MRTVIRSNSIASRRGFYYGFMARFMRVIFAAKNAQSRPFINRVSFLSQFVKKRPLCSRTERPLFIKETTKHIKRKGEKS